MDSASIYYLGVTLILFLAFAAIVARTYSKRHRDKGEEPKFRMMDDDKPKKDDHPEN
ncbi:cbb3-type cytochrome c oxidase subunit 3 [Geomonas paludis]|uniref:Cbb3-type cytochrome c oxidase subunit 3 n=1 Tax=Geomonas paludis TaxID=2740185 RepID=A0A6V8N1B0_9BACT|nr:cbb3-type cytochrome c oxidase subunit 3 [Geomonas paludis]UPU37244.1 cbb3-type cytochrome c oxidase subunit 3 [Geomonas paludis]GFO65139.1 hypothetical protein GMPD_30580 [Geomonas paludis]